MQNTKQPKQGFKSVIKNKQTETNNLTTEIKNILEKTRAELLRQKNGYMLAK